MEKPVLRAWQLAAQAEWGKSGHRGIVSVVTGGGKTIFALSCVDLLRPASTLVIVPTHALVEQWWEESAAYFGLNLNEVNIVTGKRQYKYGTVNIAVMNTAARLADRVRGARCLLVVDECHKAAAPQLRSAMNIDPIATIGLSATPERPYDSGLEDVLVPMLGELIYTYDYADALRDKVIVPFDLVNIVFDMEPERAAEYERVTRAIGISSARHGADAPETISLYMRRARVANLSLERVRLAAKIVAANRGRRTLIFHEDIDACTLIHTVLKENGVRSGLYHSRQNLRERATALHCYRSGESEVLVTCRALDEGFNVPETEIGIIAASTATRRQRIQRLGRILRPSEGKDRATIMTLVGTRSEILRLKEEEAHFDGVASVTWSRE